MSARIFNPSKSVGRLWSKAQAGFSLVEIALVLVIVGLALGGIVGLLGPQLQQRQYVNTEKQLNEVSAAIVAFAMLNRRLPCPATATATLNNRGRESFCTNASGACGAEVFPPATSAGRTRGRCTATPNAGLVPAVSLDLGSQNGMGMLVDAWGAPLRYTTTPVTNTVFNNPASALGCGAGVNTCFPFTQTNGLRNAYYTTATMVSTPVGNTVSSTLFTCVNSSGTTAFNCGTAATLANPAFLVYSLGRNQNNPSGGADETANTDNNPVFVSRERTQDDAANAFDDLLVWMPITQLLSKMTSSGVLP